ncbi:MAG: hypothetical protein HKN23_14745 [Verrucomicrobiales bacterium]|nr:hypothetical protein [Verrucomicrobiales bacterium]
MKSLPFPTLALASLAFLQFSYARENAEQQPVRGEDWVRVPAIPDGLSVSNAFQSHMVIQRDKPVKIWGWAGAPREEVTVAFAGKTATGKAGDDRAWRVKLPPVAANSEPQNLVIEAKSGRIELEDILVGDVWILGGQSNMEFDLAKVDDGNLEVVSANFPEIRLLTIPRGNGFDSVASFERLHEWSDWSKRHFKKGDWEFCSPETVREFSAIGYVFGRRVHLAASVPIGLIDVSVGGTTVETWTPQDVITKIDSEETKAWLQQWEEKIAAWDAKADLEKQISNWENRKAKFEKEGRDFKDPKPTELRPGPVADRNRPGFMFSSMIRPLEGLSVKGALFHQGFNNCFQGGDGAKMYAQVFPEMISSWRKAFADEALPFCILSLCTAGEPQTHENFAKPMYDVGPFIREAQHKSYETLREAGDETIGFASTYDFRKSWYHPQIKVPAGERAAKWALATEYDVFEGRDQPLYAHPPTIEEVKIGDGKIQLDLSTDVKTADDSLGKMVGFAIAGDDRKFVPAEISYFKDEPTEQNKKGREYRNKLVLSSPHCSEPKYYRYAWARNPMANLVNRFDLPFATQRNDDWDLEATVPGITPPEGMDPNGARRWIANNAKKELEKIDRERLEAEAKMLIGESSGEDE